MHQLMTEGPPRGYFFEPAKSIVVCTESAEMAAHATFTDFHFKYCHGARYVGGFIGTQHELDKWLQPKVDGWVSSVKTLARVAKRYPRPHLPVSDCPSRMSGSTFSGYCRILKSSSPPSNKH